MPDLYAKGPTFQERNVKAYLIPWWRYWQPFAAAESLTQILLIWPNIAPSLVPITQSDTMLAEPRRIHAERDVFQTNDSTDDGISFTRAGQNGL